MKAGLAMGVGVLAGLTGFGVYLAGFGMCSTLYVILGGATVICGVVVFSLGAIATMKRVVWGSTDLERAIPSPGSQGAPEEKPKD